MTSEPVAMPDPDRSSQVDRLALTLLALAADQNVRVLEALAACLINRARRRPEADAPPPVERAPAAPAEVAGGDFRRKLQISRRIARRALRGSLADPTQGATAFHRIEAAPAWARDLLPVSLVGGFLFYCTPATCNPIADGENILYGR